jgi:hypothetical protein
MPAKDAVPSPCSTTTTTWTATTTGAALVAWMDADTLLNSLFHPDSSSGRTRMMIPKMSLMSLTSMRTGMMGLRMRVSLKSIIRGVRAMSGSGRDTDCCNLDKRRCLLLLLGAGSCAIVIFILCYFVIATTLTHVFCICVRRYPPTSAETAPLFATLPLCV